MATCLTPINIKPTADKPARDGFLYHVVPCGKCPSCRLRRIQGWVFRLLQEEKIHQTAYFVTLTYANPPITENGYMTLCKSDLQKFFKRLRFNTKCKTIRYYAVGEYGGKTYRPHYHAIMFDVTPDDVEAAWAGSDGPVIRGNYHCGMVSNDSIAYTAKYIAKESRIPLHDADDRVPEFSLMSKKMGKNYLTPQVVKYHQQNFRSYLTMPGGATHAMPRYYRDQIFTEKDREHMNLGLSDKFDAQFAQNVIAYGSLEEYFKARHYSLLQSNKIFNNQQNRNTI